MELRGRWWNGQLSRNTRRDIWLRRNTSGASRPGKADGHAYVWTHDYPTEDDARAVIAAMIERAGGPSEWEEFATDPDPSRSNRLTMGQ
jgi:hypothetical protein